MTPDEPTALEAPTRPPEAGPGRLLVVDDDAHIRKLLARLLGAAGHVVDEAGSAEEALVKLTASAPDLIVLDMELPGKSGMSLMPILRANPRHRITPRKGRDLLANMKSLSHALEIVDHHHERMAGIGLPGRAGGTVDSADGPDHVRRGRVRRPDHRPPTGGRSAAATRSRSCLPRSGRAGGTGTCWRDFAACWRICQKPTGESRA